MPSRDSSHRIRRATAIPSFIVGDIAEAVAYYCNFLGFESVHWYGSTVVLLRGHGVTLQLRQALPKSAEVYDSCDRVGSVAVILVDRPRSLWRKFDDNGVQLIPQPDLALGRPGFFGVSDPFDNVLCIGPTRGSAASVMRWVGDSLSDAVLRRHERRRAAEEAPHLKEFRTFYEGLSNKQDIYYMFFSGKLLHWALKAMSYIPRDVNLVLLGSALPPTEADWLAKNAGRPFHHIQLRVDDQIAWEFLFAVNRYSFGWIDSDCLVLNSGLFDELTQLDTDTSLNCTWSWDTGHGLRLANTFFLFVNADVIAAVRNRGLDVSPYSYDYEWQNLQVPGRDCYSRVPTRTQQRRLLDLLPPDESGRPSTPRGMSFFDTMVMYQLLARTCGFHIHQVRSLEGFGHIRGLPVQDESTDELLHVGGVSKADALDDGAPYFHDDDMKLFYLMAESVILTETADRLPPYYARRRDQVTAALARHDLTPAVAEDVIRRYLMETRGLSTKGADAILCGPTIGISEGTANA